MSESKLATKPFEISKWKLVAAFEKVKANHGTAGVDGESIEQFEENLRGTSINCGIGCRREVISRRRSVLSRYRRKREE